MVYPVRYAFGVNSVVRIMYLTGYTSRMEITVASLVPAAWIVTGAVTLLTGVVGAILGLHWFRYGMNRLIAMTALGVYAGVSLLFIGSLMILISAMAA